MLRSRALACVLCLAAVLGLAFLPGPAAGTAQPGRVRLELLRAPVWRKPDQPLNIRLRITNQQPDRIEAFRLAVGVEDRIGSRSALHDSFERPSSYQPSTFPKDYEKPMAPGATRVISIRDSTSKLDLLDLASEGGVYPLTITFQDLSRDEI
ncbi:MAG: hypothetical protein H0V97_11480, partial [Actinobacteria bacterium]|nr:hypothetical protein [Actinomycetota bacterium]